MLRLAPDDNRGWDVNSLFKRGENSIASSPALVIKPYFR
jgi:hypothetical protein